MHRSRCVDTLFWQAVFHDRGSLTYTLLPSQYLSLHSSLNTTFLLIHSVSSNRDTLIGTRLRTNQSIFAAGYFTSCRFITIMYTGLKVPAKNSPALLFLSRGKAADCCFSFFFFSPAEEERAEQGNSWRELSNTFA